MASATDLKKLKYKIIPGSHIHGQLDFLQQIIDTLKPYKDNRYSVYVEEQPYWGENVGPRPLIGLQ